MKAFQVGCVVGVCGTLVLACGSSQTRNRTAAEQGFEMASAPSSEAVPGDTAGDNETVTAVAPDPEPDTPISLEPVLTLEPSPGGTTGVSSAPGLARQSPTEPAVAVTLLARLEPVVKNKKTQGRGEVNAGSGDNSANSGAMELAEHEVGKVRMEQDGDIVKIVGTFQSLEPGRHGFTIRADSRCTSSSRVRHFNPTGSKHGPPSSSVRHAGDLGNITVDQQGRATFEMETDSFTVEAGHASVAGLAIVVTSREDKGSPKSPSSGGPALACGTLELVGVTREPMASSK